MKYLFSGVANRPTRLLIACAALILAVAGVGLVDQLISTPAQRTTFLTGIGGPFTLLDQDGRTVTDATFRGKWMLIYFGYTHCPDACPTALNTIAEALDRIGATRGMIQPLFITVDPERDTPAAMKDYTAAFGANILGLTGTAQEIAAVAREYRISYETHAATSGDDYGIDHSSIIFLVDPNGKPVSFFSDQTTPERLARHLGETVG